MSCFLVGIFDLVVATLEAVRLYEEHHRVSGCAVMMVVLPGETNTSDQRQLEFALWERHRIPMVFATLREMAPEPDAKNHVHQAVNHEGQEIAVVYYRSGYMPEHYPSETEWEGRRALELSRAVKVYFATEATEACPCPGLLLTQCNPL